MSDRTHQTLTNLAYEVRAICIDQHALFTRLNNLNPNLVSDDDVKVASKRIKRLQTIVRGLQQQAKQD